MYMYHAVSDKLDCIAKKLFTLKYDALDQGNGTLW